MSTSTQVFDLEAARVERDRQLAKRFLELQEAETAVRQIHEETKLNLRTVRRGIYRQLDWARECFPDLSKGVGPRADDSATQ